MRLNIDSNRYKLYNREDELNFYPIWRLGYSK
jgi:hypothetical protein